MSNELTAYYHSPIGWLEIKANTYFVFSIWFVEEQKQNSDSHPLLSSANTQLKQYFTSERKIFDFPMQQKGTDFQNRVWNQLLTIPFGKTLSYQQLSKNIGDVKAIRAVGTTNGKNQLGIVVPCHRVIGTDGSLTGYAGGLWRKKWLLEHEQNSVSQQQKLF